MLAWTFFLLLEFVSHAILASTKPESNRWSRDELREKSQIATSPESLAAKSPVSPGESILSEKKAKKPIGGIAVLPPSEMKRIEDRKMIENEKVRSPTESADRPKAAVTVDRSDSIKNRYQKRDSKIMEEVIVQHFSLIARVSF